MIGKLKSKKGLSIILLLVSTLVIGLSYGVFTISTSNYDATNLLISNLSYGLTIKEDGSTSTINERVVTVPSNTLAYFNVTITSINKIDSKYNLAYKTNSNVIVEYTDRTSWSSTGIIESYDNMVYTRKVRVVIDNSSNDNDAQVEFGVFGGYSFNTISSIDLGNGFITVGGPYKEITSISSKRLVDIIESDTDCLTTSSCLYGGGSLNNYLQYPTSENKNENIWRITGSYNIDGVTVAKVVGTIQSQTTVNNINSSLSSFYNTLDRKDIVHQTNKFNCSDVGCTTSSYNNIGLLSTYEYNKIGGINSYLANTNSFFSLNNTSIQNVTSSGIEETNGTTSSGLRPTIYLNSDIKVTGSGTSNDPYRISEQSDINLMAYTLDGSPTDKTYEWLLQNKYVSNITCKNGTKASWDASAKSIILTETVTPDYCTINFADGPTLADALKIVYPPQTGTPSTGVPTTAGLYTNRDEHGKIYYFNGNGTKMNNWVKFADKLWRVIRINGNGSVRLLYAGTGREDGYVGDKVAFNSVDSYPANIGWKYSLGSTLEETRKNENKSDSYVVLENWYKTSIENQGLSKYIDTEAIYCNAREKSVNGTFFCDNMRDRFYKFGLITANEIIAAGGADSNGYRANSYFYLNKDGGSSTGTNTCLTMTPYYSMPNRVQLVYMGTENHLKANLNVNLSSTVGVVRPVISLKKEVQVISGDGSGNNPYTVTLP